MKSSPQTVSVIVALTLSCAGAANATADGPDHYQVTGVTSDGVLNMRAEPSEQSTVISQIPSNTDGLLSFGCVGGLTFEEWENASTDEREAARKTRWCLVGYDRVIGWSAGWFLTEGNGPDALNAGDRLSDLAGSEWLLRDVAGEPVSVEAWINFATDGTAFGSSGCNRFNSDYVQEFGAPLMNSIAMTRRACPGEMAETEKAFMAALGNANRVEATHLLLALFEDNTLLVTLTRRDAD